MITVQKRKFVERHVYGRSVRITLHFHLCNETNVFIVIFFSTRITVVEQSRYYCWYPYFE